MNHPDLDKVSLREVFSHIFAFGGTNPPRETGGASREVATSGRRPIPKAQFGEFSGRQVLDPKQNHNLFRNQTKGLKRCCF